MFICTVPLTAPLWCSSVLFPCTAPLWCSFVLFPCTATLCCSSVLLTCTAPLYCSLVPFLCDVLLHCSSVQFLCTIPLKCFSVLFLCTVFCIVHLFCSSIYWRRNKCFSVLLRHTDSLYTGPLSSICRMLFLYHTVSLSLRPLLVRYHSNRCHSWRHANSHSKSDSPVFRHETETRTTVRAGSHTGLDFI